MPQHLITERQILDSLAAVEAAGMPTACPALYPYLTDQRFLVKAKALITLGRLGTAEEGPRLLTALQNEASSAFKLAMLDAWWQLPQTREQRAEGLIGLLPQLKQPSVLRGAVFLLGQTGGARAVLWLADYCPSRAAWLLRDELLYAIWVSAAQSVSADFRAECLATRPSLRLWLQERPAEPQVQGSLYPSADYFWQQARAAGVAQQDFRAIYYRARKKR